MWIPKWTFWIIFWVVILFVSWRITKNQSDWDFVSPLIAAGVIMIGVAFTLGYCLKGCF
jgi:hypothetical protein